MGEDIPIEQPVVPALAGGEQQSQSFDAAVASGLDAFEAQLSGTAQLIADNPGVYSGSNWPESFSSNVDMPTRQALETGNYDVGLFSRYLTLSRRAREISTQLTGRQPDASAILYGLNDRFPAELLQRVFASEQPDGELHTTVRDSLRQGFSESHGSLMTEIGFLQSVYGVARPIDLLRSSGGGDPFRDEVRAVFLSEKGIKWLAHLEINSAKAQERVLSQDTKLADMKWTHQTQEIKRRWMRDVLMTATGMDDPELADSYVFAASRAVSDGEMKMPDIVQKIEALGPERLRLLREFNGIHALADYSAEQLERMALLAGGDAQEIARLQQHDVQVVFINKMGDHNSILSNVPTVTDDAGHRTVFFETQGWPDFYRDMAALRKMGIAPAKLIFAHHGDIGQSPISRKPGIDETDRFMQIATVHARSFVEQRNRDHGEEESFYGYSMHGMRGFTRLVDDYMQPSRGIDDSAHVTGEKLIIFDSCHAAGELLAKDVNVSTGEVIELQDESIISQLASDLSQNGVRSHVVLYAADTGIQISPTEAGFQYTEMKQGAHTRTPLEAMRIEVNGGTIIRGKVMEVPLRGVDQAALANA